MFLYPWVHLDIKIKAVHWKKGSYDLLGDKWKEKGQGEIKSGKFRTYYVVFFDMSILIFLFSDFASRSKYLLGPPILKLPQTECKREYIFNVIFTQLSSRNRVLFSFYNSINFAMLQTCVMSCANFLHYMTTSAGEAKDFTTVNEFNLWVNFHEFISCNNVLGLLQASWLNDW